MAGKLKYVEVAIQSDSKSLAGYTVLGDAVVDGERRLILKRSEGLAPPAKKAKTAKKAVTGKQTAFDPSEIGAAQ